MVLLPFVIDCMDAGVRTPTLGTLGDAWATNRSCVCCIEYVLCFNNFRERVEGQGKKALKW